MVYNDIEKSDIKFSSGTLTLYFSSNLYYTKFVNSYENFIREEIAKLRVKYKANLICDEMILLLLYKKIEKRGFRAYINDLRLKEQYIIVCDFDGLSFKK